MYLKESAISFVSTDVRAVDFLLACEVESGANYEMPVRCFTYDSIEYTDQLKEWKRKPANVLGKRKNVGKNGGAESVVHCFRYFIRYYTWERKGEEVKITGNDGHPGKCDEFFRWLPDYDICMIDIHEQNPELFNGMERYFPAYEAQP